MGSSSLGEAEIIQEVEERIFIRLEEGTEAHIEDIMLFKYPENNEIPPLDEEVEVLLLLKINSTIHPIHTNTFILLHPDDETVEYNLAVDIMEATNWFDIDVALDLGRKIRDYLRNRYKYDTIYYGFDTNNNVEQNKMGCSLVILAKINLRPRLSINDNEGDSTATATDASDHDLCDIIEHVTLWRGNHHHGWLMEVKPLLKLEKMNLKMMEEDDICSVCLVGFSEEPCCSSSIIRLSCCNHRFHEGCIFEWLAQNPTCPLCRSHTIVNVARV